MSSYETRLLLTLLNLLRDAEVGLCILGEKVVLVAGSNLLLRDSVGISWRVDAWYLDLYVGIDWGRIMIPCALSAVRISH